LNFQVFSPSPVLSNDVMLIWVMESETEIVAAPERIVADGIVELVFNYHEPLLTHFSDGSVEKEPASFIINQLNHPISIQPDGRVGVIAVRFYPWGAINFMRPDFKEYADQAVSIENIWRKTCQEIEEKLSCASSIIERVQIVQSFLLEKFKNYNCHDTITGKLVRHIYLTKGRHRISELSKETGIGQRNMERKLLTAMGASPKHFSKIARFLGSCDLIRNNGNLDLPQIALDSGYYDQSHFAHEFKSFAGVTPLQFQNDKSIVHFSLKR